MDDTDYPDLAELLKVVAIDPFRKKKMRVMIKGTDEGETVETTQIVDKLLDYIQGKVKDEGENIYKQQILPLVAEAATITLIKTLGPDLGMFLMTQHTTRDAFINMMAVGFLLMRWLDGASKKGIKIHTVEEDITEEEMNKLYKLDKITGLTSLASMSGVNPIEMLRQMVKAGQISKEDLAAIGADKYIKEEDKKKDDDDGKAN